MTYREVKARYGDSTVSFFVHEDDKERLQEFLSRITDDKKAAEVRAERLERAGMMLAWLLDDMQPGLTTWQEARKNALYHFECVKEEKDDD